MYDSDDEQMYGPWECAWCERNQHEDTRRLQSTARWLDAMLFCSQICLDEAKEELRPCD